MRRLAPLLPLLALLGGCLVHEARIETPACGPEDEGRLWINRETIDLRPGPPPPEHVERGQKPRDIPVSCYVYRRDDNGVLMRWEARVQTPLPWWQRFPCDFAVDNWPQDVVIPVTVRIAPAPVPLRDPAELLAEARAHGYAR